MGTIRQSEWSYKLTAADKLWAARMVQGEGPVEDAPAVLWTMTQLFAPAGQRLKYGRADRYRSFTDLIRAYSQPINPGWAAGGRFCSPGGRGAGTDACSSSRLQRRAQVSSMRWNQIDADKRAVVTAWFEGKLPNPVPSAIEFAAPNVSRSFLDRHPGWTRFALGHNWFLRPPESLPTVTMSAGAIGGILLVVGGGALAWFGGRWLAKRRRAR